jgi:hypothetical protein
MLVGAIEELKAVGRRYPRGAAAVASGLVLLFGFALITAISNRPSLPTAASSSALASTSPAETAESLEDDSMTLDAVEQEAESEAALLARREAMQERLRRQLALADARAMQQVPTEQEAVPVQEPPVAAPATPSPRGGRTIQIMPRTAPR